MATTQTGDLVQAAIRTAERSQSWVADKAGMTAGTLRRKVRSGDFTLAELARIAGALGVEPVTFLPAEFRESSAA
jgi:transcriptional regulator with XRE-family HTH domain